MLLLDFRIWFSYAEFRAIVLFFLVLALAISFSCSYGQGASGDCAEGGGGRAGGQRAIHVSPGKRPQVSIGEPVGGQVRAGCLGSPRKRSRDPRKKVKGTSTKHQEAQYRAPFFLQRNGSGQRDVDGRSAAGRVLLGALRDVLLADEVYASCLGRSSCLYCESGGARKGAPSPKCEYLSYTALEILQSEGRSNAVKYTAFYSVPGAYEPADCRYTLMYSTLVFF